MNLFEADDLFIEWKNDLLKEIQEENKMMDSPTGIYEAEVTNKGCGNMDQDSNYVPIWFDTLKTEVVKILASEYDFLPEDAEAAVDKSVKEKPDFWNDNSDAHDLAAALASDDDDA